MNIDPKHYNYTYEEVELLTQLVILEHMISIVKGEKGNPHDVFLRCITGIATNKAKCE